MAYATANGSAILKATVELPLYGIWCADIVLTDASEITSPCTIVLGDLTIVGAVFRSAAFSGVRSARIVGGAGGWLQAVPAKWYANGVRLSQVLADTALTVKESVSITADKSLGAYMRENAYASRVLNQLAGQNGWYVRPSDGVTLIGATRDSSQIGSRFDAMHVYGGAGRWEIATDVMADWSPGRTFVSLITTPTVNTISSVLHRLDGAKVRTEVLTTP